MRNELTSTSAQLGGAYSYLSVPLRFRQGNFHHPVKEGALKLHHIGSTSNSVHIFKVSRRRSLGGQFIASRLNRTSPAEWMVVSRGDRVDLLSWDQYGESYLCTPGRAVTTHLPRRI